MVGIIQVSRIAAFNYSKDKATGTQLEEAKESIAETTEGLKNDAIKAIKS